MAADLDGTRVVVTGASGGIGSAIASMMAFAGARVVLHYHSDVAAAEALQNMLRSQGAEAHLAQADLRERDGADDLIRDAVQVLGGIDVLVNNAGDLVERRAIDLIDQGYVQQVFDLNFGAVLWLSLAAVPWMREGGGGSIVNVSSIGAETGGGPGSLMYAAAKGAVNTLTRGLARALAQDNIRVNAIAPGIINTQFHDRHTAPLQMKEMLSAIPAGRPGTPYECATAAVFLSSGAASFITGEVIRIDGAQAL